MQRHGARYPTKGSGLKVQAAIAKLQSVEEYRDPRLEFLRTFKYELGNESLVRFGAAQ